MYAVSSGNCGNQTVSNDNATLYWASNITYAVVDIRRVDNAWNQKGCLGLGHSVLRNRFVFVPSSYTIPSYNVDYDSLYVVRMRWSGSYFFDCYFTLQPSEYIGVTGQCALHTLQIKLLVDSMVVLDGLCLFLFFAENIFTPFSYMVQPCNIYLVVFNASNSCSTISSSECIRSVCHVVLNYLDMGSTSKPWQQSDSLCRDVV